MKKEILNEKTRIALERATSVLSAREYRTEQLQMCQFLRRFLDYAKEPGQAVLVEAGTGVGKSFGYLVAACEWKKDLQTKDKIVIATNTISLQEQLTNKDIPLLSTLYPEIKIEKAKGRNNFVCQRKINDPEGNKLFSSSGDILDRVQEWLNASEGINGDRSDINFQITDKEWKNVGSDLNDCYGALCPHQRKDCFYYKAKARQEKADIIVTTHAMVLTDYAKRHGLPEYTHLILDEAHNFNKNATNALTVKISRNRIQQLINMSKSSHCKSGFRAIRAITEVKGWQTSLINFTELFLNDLTDKRYTEAQENEIGEMLLECLHQIVPIAIKASEKTNNNLAKAALINLLGEASLLAQELEIWLKQSMSNTVYWVEKNEACYVPIDIGQQLTSLWESKTSILTSATLSVAHKFDMIRTTLNLPETTYTLRLESPFNYKENGLIYIPAESASPKTNGYTEYVTQTILKALEKTGGKTFVLFTSYSMLKTVAQSLGTEVGDKFTILEQGTDTRERLMREYRENQNAVFLGTDSYWEGIDEEIDCVILTKLPFAVPTTPVEQARYEAIKSRGLNPFVSYSIPNCALKMKQGAGRLIRHQNKKGVIIICDPRITQGWGKQIVMTLPEMRWTRDISAMDSYVRVS